MFRSLPWRDPLVAFAPYASMPGATLLYGGEHAFLGLFPTRLISSGFTELDQVLAERATNSLSGPSPFTSGVMGYFGYELAGQIENLPVPHAQGPSLPDMLMGVFDAVAVFDLKAKTSNIVGRCSQKIDQCTDAILSAPQVLPQETWGQTIWQTVWSRDEYIQRIEQTLEYIRAGDIFQANIAQRFLAERPEGMTPYGLFHKLCKVNPAPFAAFLAVDEERAVVSSSPERFLKVSVTDHGRQVETRPIKGTRKRSPDAKEDTRLAHELKNSIKDRAENLMIVDLLRNDLSRTAKLGSVEVPELWSIESYATVHHLVSVITSEPQPEVSTLEILRQAFPGGSITGAPKIRAMEIIHELEGARRGPYCGSFGWIGDNGAMDTAIGIRTMIVDRNTISVSAGGGIVADSDPASEYHETLVKAAAMLRTLDSAANILGNEGL